MPETGTPKLVPPPRSHTSTEQWQSFEVRMRRRRAERCLLRAEVALEAGFAEDARAALDEARRHGAMPEETADLEQRLTAAEIPATEEAPRRRGLVIAGAVAALIGAGAVWLMLWAPDAPAQAAATSSAGLTAPQAEAPPPEPDRVPDRVKVQQLEISPSTVSPAFGETPAASATREQETEPAVPTPPPAPETGAAAETPTRLTLPDPSSSQPLTGEAVSSAVVRVPLEPVTQPPPAVLQATNAVAPPGERVEPAPVATTGSAPPPPVDERARVRETLSRYEAAYSGLDAAAARAVWPTVNQGALARAFEGLSAQRVSLGQCDVSVMGATAQAQCAGSASWTPRVGGGHHNEPRRWTFDLRQMNGAWQITRAITR